MNRGSPVPSSSRAPFLLLFGSHNYYSKEQPSTMIDFVIVECCSEWRNLFVFFGTEAVCYIFHGRKLDHDNSLRVSVSKHSSDFTATDQIVTVIMLNYGTDIFDVFLR
jgi:hypothetical protein